MPELPEVETVRAGLAPALEGRRILSVTTRRADLRIPFPPRFAERLAGRTVTAMRRRAKYLLAELDGGETLVMHLGMSGRFSILAPGAARPAGAHDHVIIETDAPATLVFTDHRRFGLMTLVATAERDEHKLFAALGPEPLSGAFSPAYLNAVLRARRTPVKAALIDQRVVAGVGNIYACEALFRARISPRRLAASVPGVRAERLAKAVKAVLEDAIAAGGSSLRDYARTNGELGLFQHRFAVYDREGKRCPRRGCGGTVVRIVQAGRSTFHCPACQR